MKVETILFSLFVAAAVCLGVVLLILFNMSPEEAGFLGLGVLFVCIFGAILGLGTIGIFQLRRRLTGNASYYDNVGISLRQAAILSTSATGLLVLQALRVLTVV